MGDDSLLNNAQKQKGNKELDMFESHVHGDSLN